MRFFQGLTVALAITLALAGLIALGCSRAPEPEQVCNLVVMSPYGEFCADAIVPSPSPQTHVCVSLADSDESLCVPLDDFVIRGNL